MSEPKRVQLSRRKGWKIPPHTVSVARPTRWGNPFRVGVDGDAAECVRKYRDCHIAGWERSYFISRLRGKNLACWCKLDEPCHADVLLEVANA